MWDNFSTSNQEQHFTPFSSSYKVFLTGVKMSTSIPGIEAIALVGSRNQRLYFNTRIAYQEKQDLNRVRNEMLRLEYAAHCALDVIEERCECRGNPLE